MRRIEARARKGSYTIEAAIVVPILIFVFAMAIRIGISFYQRVCDRDGEYFDNKSTAVETFYRADTIGGLGDGIIGN